MASKFLKSNFKSMNKTEEEKENFAEQIKKMSGAAVSEGELELLKKSIPSNIADIESFKKLVLEEDK